MFDGYPCTSLSGQNNTPASILDEASPSGLGLHCMFDYIDYAGSDVDVVITENVARLFASRAQFHGETPIAMQSEGFRQRGFISEAFLLKSQNYNLRHSRDRGWGMYLRLMSMRAAFPPLSSTIHSLQLVPLPVTKYLADVTVKKPPLVLDTQRPRLPSDKDAPKWVQDLAKVRKTLGAEACVSFVIWFL